MRRISRATAIFVTAVLLFGFSAGALFSSDVIETDAKSISAVR